jgi:predicted GTPase
MRREFTSLALRLAAYALPWAALIPLGLAWLFEHRGWIPFGVATATAAGILLLVSRGLASSSRLSATPLPVMTWPDVGQKAWEDIDRLAIKVASDPPGFGDANAYRDLLLQTLDIVGRHFHPESKYPAMEMTLSQAMEISERALRDVRSKVLDVIPLGSSITLGHVDWARRRADQLPTAAKAGRAILLANRIRRWLMNTPTAVVCEVVNLLDLSPLAIAGRQVARIGAAEFVRRVGEYAIQAFSGQASLDISTLHHVAEDAPLRILLLGPVNAGKSSLLNAMFGQERSKSDILPCPGVKGEHILDREGAPRAVVIDSDGFGGASNEAAHKRVFEEVQSVDLIVSVTSAAKADRDQECRTLDEIRRRFASETRRACPPIVVAATHIDQLRPTREWNPPYDFLDGDSPKEASIRDAVDAISIDFQVSSDRVSPVCLAPGLEYNIDEGLLPAIGAALCQADRARFLRLVELNRSQQATERASKRIDLLLGAVGRVVTQATREKCEPPH